MAAKAAATKTSPVLIVFLVIFVLASIILGVTTYLGFSGQDELLKAAKAKDDEMKKWQQDASWFQFEAIAYKSFEGHELTAKEKENLGSLWKGVDGGKGALFVSSRDPDKEAAMKVIRDDLEKNMGWDQATNKPSKTYKGELDAAQKSVAELTNNWNKAKDGEKEARDAAARDQKALETAKVAFADALNKAKDDADKDLAKHLAKNAELAKALDEMGKAKEDLRTEMADMKAGYDKKIALLERDRKQLQLVLEKYKSKIETVNVLDYDHPKGHVVRIDPSGRMVYIDVGSADNLKTGITFSVYGVGADGKPIAHDVIGPDGKPSYGPDGKLEKEGKATLEVVNVLGGPVSQARVTWTRDEGRDPILRGDVLFNPGWDPKARQHVAVTGLVDLTGEGRDDMAEFVRQLQRQGVIVDAYLDTKDISIKGRGIDRQTDYLILGINPDFQGSDLAKEDDPRAKRRQAIVKEMSDMQQKATENGVTVISLRKFLVMSGYHVPPGVGVEQSPGGAGPTGGGKAQGDK